MKQRLAEFDVARLCLLVASIVAMPAVHAHGIAGNRYFPGTLTFDDPAVADELILPNFSSTKHPLGNDYVVTDTAVAASFARLLTPDLAFGVDSSWAQWNRKGLQSQRGYGVTSISLKGRFYENDPHEALFSASLGWGLPNSGSSAIDAGVPASIQPGVFVGKGFGDLPDRLDWLRPFGVAAGFSATLPMRRHSFGTGVDPATGMLASIATNNPNILHCAVALEYSTLYLTDRFTGGPPAAEPLNQLVPLVEFAFDTPLGAALGQRTVGTMNPGLSYVAVSYQIAIEAVVPLDRAAGSSVGGRIQVLFFLDDFVPAIFGKPLFSEHPLFSR